MFINPNLIDELEALDFQEVYRWKKHVGKWILLVTISEKDSLIELIGPYGRDSETKLGRGTGIYMILEKIKETILLAEKFNSEIGEIL